MPGISLKAYSPESAVECKYRDTIAQFIESHADPFNRSHLHAHLTGSALIVSHDGTQILLGFHKKLGKWLQMGGHGEPGETDPLAVAMREAIEESGITNLELDANAPAPIDLDVHTIPGRADVPEHLHLDIRYVLRAPSGATHSMQIEEQEDMRWFRWEEANVLELDPSLQRLIQKARKCIAA